MGIIPAHAGFTPRPCGPTGPWSDHPRTRGVYGSTRSGLQVHGGSSPHTRGLLDPGGPGSHGNRIIPAHAGFTNIGYSQPRRWTGSSPHTRGLRGAGRSPAGGPRIIPAHAGFTRDWAALGRVIPDHPRTRGVYGQMPAEAADFSGSSPHTRGLHQRSVLPASPRRIIPAHAGFTHRTRGRWCPSPDHPRTRGVYWIWRCLHGETEGSSPHTRGLPLRQEHVPRQQRIIPAHAGFTLRLDQNHVVNPDHPRTRGVYR